MRKLLLLILSLPVTILLVAIAGATTEFSIWESRAAILFFPYAMLARSSYALFLQMPLYALVVGVAWMKARLKLILALLLLLHAGAAALALKFDFESRGRWIICCPEERR